MTNAEGYRQDLLKHVKVTDITIGERFREDFGNLEELKESIKEKGIIQPLSITSEYCLLAGGRRLEAAKALGLETVPVIIRPLVDEADSREIELMENLHRKDFTWAEEARLVRRIDQLYKEKKEGNWSGRKTAALLGRGVATVARNLQLAEALEYLPELGEFKTADEALTVLKKLEDHVLTEVLVEQQTKRLDPKPREALPNAAVIEAQCASGIRTMLKLATANYNISDPLQGMMRLKASSYHLTELNIPTNLQDNPKTYNELLTSLCTEAYRLSTKNSWLIVWITHSWYAETLAALKAAGWDTSLTPPVWIKTHTPNLGKDYLAEGYESFFLARKGSPKIALPNKLNTFYSQPLTGKAKYNDTHRPVDLMEDILSCLISGQSNVLIPYLGSGATLLACYSLNFQSLGFEATDVYKSKFLLDVEKQARNLFG